MRRHLNRGAWDARDARGARDARRAWHLWSVWGAAALAAAGFGLSQPACALTSGKTGQDLAFVGGGIADTDRETLRAGRMRYSLWVQTVSIRGAYLSEARLAILTEAGAPVIDVPMGGPWLFVDLKPGAYRISVNYGGSSETRELQVRAGAHNEMVFYFEAPATPSKIPPARIPD
jgi:hypothetical protein